MNRSTLTRVLVMLTLCSSAAYALARRHDAWDGMVLGKGGSKIRGIISMVNGKAAGTTLAEVKYTGDVRSVTRPWRVRVGSCAKGGAVLGGDGAYTPMRVDATGAAQSQATLRVALPDSGSYYVSIHESASTMSRIVACGDLLMEE